MPDIDRKSSITERERDMGMYETVRRDEDPLVLDANTPENLSADVESSLLNSPRSDGSGRGGGNASKRRLVSLDVFRGLTVAVMLFFPSPLFLEFIFSFLFYLL